MVLKIWDNGGQTADRYTARIHENFWTMSKDADMPDGICMYIGEYLPEEGHGRLLDKNEYLDLPEGIRRQIGRLS